MNNVRPTLADVARAAGVSGATVSMALRGDGRIKPSTRELVVEAADRLGYVLDPEVSRTMRLIRRPGAGGYRETIAFLVPRENAKGWKFEKILHKEASQRAASLGFALERIEVEGGLAAARRTARLCLARGWHGLIVGSFQNEFGELPLPWERFSAVSIGYTLANPVLHRVARDLTAPSLQLFARLEAAGYKRIGFLSTQADESRLAHHCLAAWLFHVRGRDAPQPFVSETMTPADVQTWIRRERPDVVVNTISDLAAVRARVGENIPVCTLVTSSATDEFTGLYPNYEELARAAVQQVSMMLMHRECGVPATPFVHLVPPLWCEGRTARLGLGTR